MRFNLVMFIVGIMIMFLCMFLSVALASGDLLPNVTGTSRDLLTMLFLLIGLTSPFLGAIDS